jgi:hypothetical protein
MSRKRFALILLALAALMLVVTSVVGHAQEKPVKFTLEDRKAIDTFYTHLYGEIAPGALDRKDYSTEIEKVLKPGGKVPMQLEKELEWLPAELEKKLVAPPGGYLHYKLGRHVLIMRRSDLYIADIVKDVGLK